MRGLRKKHVWSAGFTLIELSVVLVIIGLIVGGVLVGKDLVNAAALRATIAQVDRFNTAVNTFYVKYNCLPGDCANAANFGFVARGLYAGEGDGNGVLEGIANNQPGQNYGIDQGAGETVVFWEDLSASHLIEGSYTTASINTLPGSSITGTAINNWLPAAKLGSNYFYAYSFSPGCVGGLSYEGNTNMFGLSAITSITGAIPLSSPGLTVQQAYNIDGKIDDGLPTRGKVVALYVDQNAFGGCGVGYAANAAAVSSTTCFTGAIADTASTSGTYTYSVTASGVSNLNCALSFKMQGAPQ